MTGLTSRQAETLLVIARHERRFGVFPTLRQLAVELKVGSHVTVYDRVLALHRKGFIRRVPQGLKAKFRLTEVAQYFIATAMPDSVSSVTESNHSSAQLLNQLYRGQLYDTGSESTSANVLKASVANSALSADFIVSSQEPGVVIELGKTLAAFAFSGCASYFMGWSMPETATVAALSVLLISR